MCVCKGVCFPYDIYFALYNTVREEGTFLHSSMPDIRYDILRISVQGEARFFFSDNVNVQGEKKSARAFATFHKGSCHDEIENVHAGPNRAPECAPTLTFYITFDLSRMA